MEPNKFTVSVTPVSRASLKFEIILVSAGTVTMVTVTLVKINTW